MVTMYPRHVAMALLAATVNAVPHLGELGAVTLMTDNDLAGNLTKRTGGAILLEPSSYEVAAKRCASLNEQLWSPSTSDFTAGLNSSLSYEAYLDGNNGKKLYWTASPRTPSSCNAISTNGALTPVPCDRVLPGLCTQSAPNSQAGEADTSLKYQISVDSGRQTVTGFRSFHTFRFNGIRFAPQPKRFTFSTLYEGSGSVDATQYGPGCIQGPDARFPILSEDCLFLNVWTPYLPAKSPGPSQKKKLKAVMVWITGGGFTAGTGTDPEKEGGNLASRGDVVVVTINYRLGNLGFLSFNDGVHNGNYAISDMVTALRWINKYIEAFGGDPKRVTIWGESSGAGGVKTLLAVPAADKLINGAIMQSMAGDFGKQFGNVSVWNEPKEAYLTTTIAVLKETGCEGAADELACLSQIDAAKLLTKTMAMFPTHDGTLIKTRRLPLSGPLSHRHNIPILLGTNRDETSYAIPVGSTNFTQMLEIASSALGANVMSLEDSSFAPDRSLSWPSLSEAEKAKAVTNATGQVIKAAVFGCPTTAFAYSSSKNNIFSPVYQFEFNRTYSPARFADAARILCGRDLDDPEHIEYYKCHAGEVPFTFGNILSQNWRDRDGLDTPFARLVVDYWSAFARTGTMQPEKGYLEARGWRESQAKIESAGVWATVPKGVMSLQWGRLGMVPHIGFPGEETGCTELNFGKDYYESLDNGVTL